MSPAGDGATVERADMSCEWCGADVDGTLRVRVDEWSAICCRQCEDDARAAVPGSCVLYPLPRATEGDR